MNPSLTMPVLASALSPQQADEDAWLVGAPQLVANGVTGIDTNEHVATATRVSAGFDVDETGHVNHPRVQLKIFPGIERGAMHSINGLIVHQTGGSTAQSTFNSYQHSIYGAHFLIGKDGAIYQTASLKQRCNHVGNLKSRCVAESRCTPTELTALKGKAVGSGIGRVEAGKEWPDRYPGNSDSIGIELVGAAAKSADGKTEVYEPITPAQQTSLSWLVGKLRATYNISLTEVFRHPEVSWKNETEASSATW